MSRLLFWLWLFFLYASPAVALRVGLVIPLSGSEGKEGVILRLWAGELAQFFYRTEGIRLELIPLDSRGRPSHIPSLMKEAFLSGVEVLIGPARPECALILAKEAKKWHIPLILTAGEINPIKQLRRPPGIIFHTGLTTRAAVKVLYHCLKKKGYHQIGLLISTDSWGKEGEKWLQAYAAEYGLRIKKTRYFGPYDTDVTFHLEALLDTEAVVCWASPWASLTVARNIDQMGLKLPVYFSHHISPEGFLRTYPALLGKPFVGAAFLAPEDLFPGNKALYELLINFVHRENLTYDLSLAALADAFVFLKNGIENGQGNLVKGLEKTGLIKGVTGLYFVSPDDHYGLLPATVGVYKYEALSYEPVCRPRAGVL